jgi:hypothetical protein
MEKKTILKFNNLLKHVSHYKVKVTSPCVEVGAFYLSGKCQHA